MQYTYIVALAGLVAGALLGWLWSRHRSSVLEERANMLAAKANELESQLTGARRELTSAHSQITTISQRFTQADTERAAIQFRLEDLEAHLKTEQSQARSDADGLRAQIADAV